MTLAVPQDLKRVMDAHKEVKWSEIARQAMWNHARKLQIVEKILSKSKLTENETIEIGREINKAVAKRHGL